MWVDRKGGTTKLLDEPGAYANPRLSPDGKRLALTVLRDGNFDIWVHDLERGVPTRLTFDDASDSEQVWSPDGRYLAFSSGRSKTDNIYRKRADGSGDEERLTTSDDPHWANSWAPDGQSIAVSQLRGNGNFDVMILTLADKQLKPLLTSSFRECDPAISPDGRWLAYASNEAGRAEIYVRPFPSGSGRWQVSDNGGGVPALVGQRSRALLPRGRRADGRLDRGGRRQHAYRQAGPAVHRAVPRRVGGIAISGNTFADYDVSADGQRFVMFPSTEVESTNRGVVTFVTRWFDDLTKTFAPSH